VKKEGLTLRLGEKTRTDTALGDWIGQRAQAADSYRTDSLRKKKVRLRCSRGYSGDPPLPPVEPVTQWI
jgi:hypothetical protein